MSGNPYGYPNSAPTCECGAPKEYVVSFHIGSTHAATSRESRGSLGRAPFCAACLADFRADEAADGRTVEDEQVERVTRELPRRRGRGLKGMR